MRVAPETDEARAPLSPWPGPRWVWTLSCSPSHSAQGVAVSSLHPQLNPTSVSGFHWSPRPGHLESFPPDRLLFHFFLGGVTGEFQHVPWINHLPLPPETAHCSRRPALRLLAQSEKHVSVRPALAPPSCTDAGVRRLSSCVCQAPVPSHPAPDEARDGIEGTGGHRPQGHTHACTQICACAHAHTHSCTHRGTCMHMHTETHACTHTDTNMCTHACVHSHTHTHDC